MVLPACDAVVRQIRRLASHGDASPDSDRELLERYVRRRDEAAFERVMRRHGPMVLGVCRRALVQAEDAEDVFQATFLVLARKAGVVAWQDSVASWLYAVAHRLALEARGQRLRRQARELHAVSRLVADPLAEITARELVTLVDGELGRLPDKLRAPLVLCIVQGKTGEEAARELGCSASTLKRRLRRGREHLEYRLRRRGLALAACLSALALHGTSSANLPPALLTSVLRTASALRAGRPMAVEGASARAMALAAGLGRTVFVRRVVVVAACLLIAGGLVTGAAVLLGRAAPDPEEPSGSTFTAREPLDARAAATDRFGDPLPAGAVARLGTVRWRHEGWVGPFACAPDGRSVASAALRTLTFWDFPDGTPRHRVTLPAEIHCLAYAPDGKSLAAGGSDGWIRILDPSSGKELRRLNTHVARRPAYTGGGVYGVRFTPDGRSLVSWDSDEVLCVWDPTTGTELRRFGKELHPTRQTLSPDGRLLAAVVRRSDQPVQLWDVATGQAIRSLTTPGEVGSLAFSADSKTLAAGVGKGLGPARIVRWDLATGKELAALAGHDSLIFALEFAPDGKTLATGGYDRTIRLWDLATGKQRVRIGPHDSPVYQLAFTPDGKTLIGREAENRLRFWDPTTGQEIRDADAPEGSVTALAYSPSGRFVAAASNRTIWLWDPVRVRSLGKLIGHEGRIMGLVVSADGRLLVSSGQDGMVILWDPVVGKELRRLKASNSRVDQVALSPDGRRIATWNPEDRPDQVKLWSVATGRSLPPLAVVQEQPGVVPVFPTLVFSPDGRRLLAASGTSLRLLGWDVETGQAVPLGGPHDGGVNAAAYSPDGRMIAAASMGGTLYLWEVATGQPRLILKNLGYTTTLAFSPDGRLLAMGGDGTHRAIQGDKMLYPGWDERGRVRIINTADGQLLHSFAGHSGGVFRLAFAPDGRTVASASADTTVLLWDASSCQAAVRRSGAQLTSAQLGALWQGLRGDAARAYRAQGGLSAAPTIEVIPFLKDHIRPVVTARPEVVAALLRQLDSPSFAEREQAMTALRKLGDAAEPALRRTLAARPKLEVRRRITQLLAAFDFSNAAGKRLRTLRAVEVLERRDDAASRDLLAHLASGDAEGWLTREAKASLQRMERRPRPAGGG